MGWCWSVMMMMMMESWLSASAWFQADAPSPFFLITKVPTNICRLRKPAHIRVFQSASIVISIVSCPTLISARTAPDHLDETWVYVRVLCQEEKHPIKKCEHTWLVLFFSSDTAWKELFQARPTAIRDHHLFWSRVGLKPDKCTSSGSNGQLGRL